MSIINYMDKEENPTRLTGKCIYKKSADGESMQVEYKDKDGIKHFREATKTDKIFIKMYHRK